MPYRALFFLLLFGLSACSPAASKEVDSATNVRIVSAMRQVMHKGELGPKIKLDTIGNRRGLFGIGPLSGLRGEITVYDGKPYVSRVDTSNRMVVTEEWSAAAPFFVYANQTDWKEVKLPAEVTDLGKLEEFIGATVTTDVPFVFKLSGTCRSAIIHCQNLPPGTKVSSPAEAHQGQVDYELENVPVDLVGFYSTNHHGVFTHHDTNMHVHLVTQDRNMMGHLDAIAFVPTEFTLFLPE